MPFCANRASLTMAKVSRIAVMEPVEDRRIGARPAPGLIHYSDRGSQGCSA